MVAAETTLNGSTNYASARQFINSSNTAITLSPQPL